MKKNITLLALAFISINVLAQIPAWIPNPGTAGALQAFYSLNGNTSDLTANGLHLVNNGASPTSDRFGNANGAYSFNGTSNYMIRSNFPKNVAGNFAISVWIKKDVSTGNGIVVQKGQYTAVNNLSSGAIILGNASMESRIYLGPSPVSATSTNVGGNTNWNHVVLDYDGNNVYCFVNGVANGIVASSSPNNAISDLTIGAWKVEGVNYLYFPGKIDEVAVYSGPLTVCEVRDIYNSCVLSQPTPQTGAPGGSAQFVVGNDCYSSAGITYQWQMNNGTGFTNLSNAGQFSGTNTNTLTISNLTTGNHNTQYKCIINNGAGCSKTTNVVALTISPVGIGEVKEANAFSLSPNPAMNFATLTVSDKLLNEPYSLFNELGQAVMEGKISGRSTNLDLSTLAEGIYTLKLAGTSARLIVSK